MLRADAPVAVLQGMAGGPDLLILFVTYLLLFVVPVGLLVLGVVYWFVWRDDDG